MSVKNNDWFVSLKKKAGNAMQLICFHYAGGGAYSYCQLSGDIIDNCDVISMQLPGRDNRFQEDFASNMEEVIEELSSNIESFCDKPFVFFGHSLGALIAFELARELQKKNITNLKHLIVSGCDAPQIPLKRKKLYDLSDDDLIEEIQKFNGMPKEILAERELLTDVILPIIRGDFTISDLYKYQQGKKLLCPITAIGGEKDSTFDPEDLLKWNEQSDVFKFKYFPGDHFFINSSRNEVAKYINGILSDESAI